METPLSSTELLKVWRHRARSNQKAHYEMEARCARKAFWFGNGSAVLSAIVSVLVLIAVRIDPPTWLRISTASISIVVAAITAVATSSKWSEKAAQHHSTAAEYGKVFRKIEEVLVLPSESDEIARKTMKAIREKMDQIPSEAPPVLKSVWRNLPAHLTPPSQDSNAGQW